MARLELLVRAAQAPAPAVLAELGAIAALRLQERRARAQVQASVTASQVRSAAPLAVAVVPDITQREATGSPTTLK